MVLHTQRLSLRPWQLADADRLYVLAKDPHVGPPCGWDPHQSAEESRMILEKVLMNAYTWAIVLRDEDTVIGDISLIPYGSSRMAENEQEAEIGYWLGYPEWNHGYMTEACARIMRYGFEERSLQVLRASHSELNPASGKVMAKCGMKAYAALPTIFPDRFPGTQDIRYMITRDEWLKQQNR